MKKYVTKNSKHADRESRFIKGRWKTRYFYTYCDICGLKHPDVCVNELCEEEGFPEGDYCWNCQMSMRAQGFVGEDKSTYFLKKDYPNITKNDHIWEGAVKLHRLGKYREAIKLYDSLLKECPESIPVLVNKGEALNRINHFKRAIKYQNKVLSIDPINLRALLHKSNTLIHLKEYQKAMNCLNFSLKINPLHFNAMSNKGKIFFRKGKYVEAIRWYNKALKIEPNSILILINMASALEKLGKQEEARKYYNKIFKLPLKNEPKYIKDVVRAVKLRYG